MNAVPQSASSADAARAALPAAGPAARHRAFARTRVLAGLPRGGSSLTASGITTTVSV